MAKTTFQDLVVRGKDYREDHEFELYGEETTVVIRPLSDEYFLPILSDLSDALGVEDLEADEAVEEVEEAREEQSVDPTEMNDEFVDAIQEAAVLGVCGGYDEDGEFVEYSNEETAELVSAMIGGSSVELGSRVLELSGDMRDAEKFH